MATCLPWEISVPGTLDAKGLRAPAWFKGLISLSEPDSLPPSNRILPFMMRSLSVLFIVLWSFSTSSIGAELLGYYEFEDNFADSSGNEKDAESAQNPDEVSFTDEGFRGKAIDINDPTEGEPNSGGSVDIPIDANAAELPGVTFGGWVNIDPDTVEFDGFMAMDNGGWDRGITVNYNGSNLYGIASGAAPIEVGEITPGEWQFIAATFDVDEAETWLYVGGDLAANQTTESETGADLADLGEPVIEIGRYDNQDLDAKVDDVFVFDTALDAFHVNALRNLRLSELDYSPFESAQVFKLFEAGTNGNVGGRGWSVTTELDASEPGAVLDVGEDGIAVVLNESGQGMLTGAGEVVDDSDGDGLLDSWELIQFGDLNQGADGDPDEDQLTNLEEQDAGTRPNRADSDGDGLADGAEVKTHGTNPGNPDTDGDGSPDGVEIAAGTDPKNPASLPKPPPAELLAAYEFEGDFEDLSGNGNTARPEQNPDEVSFIADGFRGQSVDINDPDAEPNSGGTVNIPIDANPDQLEEVTFGGWVNVEEFEFDGFMAIDNGGWDRGITVNAQSSNAFGIASGAGPANLESEIEPGSWQYVVGTFSKKERRSILYVGSSSEGDKTTETIETNDNGNPPGEPEIEIGRYDNQDLDGAVDDIFVFGGELNPHEVNAIRNLRLSSLDLAPRDVSEVFTLFSESASGSAGGVGWIPTSGLTADPPGAVESLGGAFTVVLDDQGNGMMTGQTLGFVITSVELGLQGENRTVTLTWKSRAGRNYALDSSQTLGDWIEVDDGIESGGSETTYLDASPSLSNDLVRYYRVREVP